MNRLKLRDEIARIEQARRITKAALWCIILAVVAVICASCTIVNHPTAGYYASLGGDTTKMKADSAGYSFDSNSNSAAFRDVIKQIRLSWQSYLVAEGLKFLSGKYYDHEGKIVDSATTVKLEELRNAQTLAEGEQALQALKLSTP